MVRLVSFLSFGFIPTYSSDPVTPTKKQKFLRSLHSLSPYALYALQTLSHSLESPFLLISKGSSLFLSGHVAAIFCYVGFRLLFLSEFFRSLISPGRYGPLPLSLLSDNICTSLFLPFSFFLFRSDF